MSRIMVLPKIGVNMVDATIVKWLAKEGEEVKEGDILLEAETDKATQEIPSTETGILAKIITGEGENVECQQPIAVFIDEGETFNEDELDIKEEVKEEPEPVVEKPVKIEEKITKSETTMVDDNERVKISPLAKKIAKENGIDISVLEPSVPGKRITKADVMKYLDSITKESTQKVICSDSATLNKSSIPYEGIRKVIGERMTQSASIPTVPLNMNVDISQILQFRKRLKAKNIKVGFNEILIAIVAKALKEYPIMNSKLEDGQIKLINDVNIGVAVHTDKGLLVPVIKDVANKKVSQISEEFRGKVANVKEGKFSGEDISGGTFTITNLGMFEVENFVPIINPPECAILGVGSIIKKQEYNPNEDCFEEKSTMTLTLVFDHRIVDGAPAAKFLQRIKHIIECPMELLI